MKKILAVTTGVILCVLVTGAAVALMLRPQCGPRGVISSGLSDNFSEEMVWRGMMEGSIVAELWAGKVGEKSWTFLVANGERACIVQTGKGWHYLAPLGSPASLPLAMSA